MKNLDLSKADERMLKIASVYYIGYFPIASGTVASLVAMLVMYALKDIISPAKGGFTFALYLFVTGLIIYYGTMAADKTEEILKEKDSHKIVIDEVAGFFVSMLFLPITCKNLLLAFIFFRIFDVIKPFGIRDLQKYKGGFGIMIDDLAAGVYTVITLKILFWIF